MWLLCDHVVRGTLWMISALYKSPSCYGWWLKTSCKRRYFVFSLSRDLMCLRAKRITWLYGGVSLVISEYHTNFLTIIDLSKEEILSFQFFMWPHVNVWPEDHVTSWALLVISYYPLKFGGYRLCGIGDIKRLICHVTSRDNVIRGSCDIIGVFPSSQAEPAMFYGCRPCRRGDILFLIGNVI